MAELSSRQIALVISGLKLLYELFGTLDKALLLRSLRKKVPVPNVTRVPNWEDTKSFIEANPEFVGSEEFRKWWDSREQTQNRVRLMISLARELRSQQGVDFYLFAPEVREDAAVRLVVMSVLHDIKSVLDDPTTSEEEKTEKIAEILREAGQ